MLVHPRVKQTNRGRQTKLRSPRTSLKRDDKLCTTAAMCNHGERWITGGSGVGVDHIIRTVRNSTPPAQSEIANPDRVHSHCDRYDNAAVVDPRVHGHDRGQHHHAQGATRRACAITVEKLWFALPKPQQGPHAEDVKYECREPGDGDRRLNRVIDPKFATTNPAVKTLLRRAAGTGLSLRVHRSQRGRYEPTAAERKKLATGAVEQPVIAGYHAEHGNDTKAVEKQRESPAGICRITSARDSRLAYHF